MSDEGETKTYHVSVEYDYWKGGRDFEEFTVSAESEEKAIEYASNRPNWPDPNDYDEDDVSVREM